MNVPKETIWQELRTEVLSTIPPESRARITEDNSLSRWYQEGYFAVQAATKRAFQLRTSPSDLGGALLADAEHFLDAAAEHQVSLWRQINSATWLSPAWLTVTFYYWAFFLCLATTRLLGNTVWFLDRQTARSLSALAPTPTNNPGAGCFRFFCGAITTMSEREVTLTKTGGRLHDELWIIWANSCESKFKRLSKGSSASLEERLFAALTRTTRILGPNWQSAFRNAVNYRTAFAYSAVRRDRVLESLSYLRTPITYDFLPLIERYEANVLVLTGPAAIIDQPQAVAEVLFDYTFLLQGIADALYWEFIDRHHLDRRWADSRTRFLKGNAVYSAGDRWPC